MSVKIWKLVWDHYPAGRGERLTALALADHAHDDGTNVRPGIAHLAKKTWQSERTVQRYLAKMRDSKWLLTVRRGDGGRGLATEYRINPLWITNPDRLSHFTANSEERVTPEVKKGDTGGMKRVTPVSSQPSITVKEPTTTVSPQSEHNGNTASPLCWPAVLQGPSEVSAIRILDACPPADRQSVLDEVAGLAERRCVRFPLGLLRKLVELSGKGKFIPSAAIAYRQEKDKARCPPDQVAEVEKTPSTPEKRRQALVDLAVLRAEIVGKGRIGSMRQTEAAVRSSWRASG